MSRTRAAAVATVVGIALFWLGISIAGAVAPGYSASADYISSLASRGSTVAPLAIASLTVAGIAHVAAAGAVLLAWRSWVLAGLLALAGLSTIVLAGFRLDCPRRAAGCSVTNGLATDVVEQTHGIATGAYQLFMVLAMVTVVVRALRRTRPGWMGVVAATSAVASLALVAQLGGAHTGTWQRLWVATNDAWLILVVVVAVIRPAHD